jgi:hypothetical protein
MKYILILLALTILSCSEDKCEQEVKIDYWGVYVCHSGETYYSKAYKLQMHLDNGGTEGRCDTVLDYFQGEITTISCDHPIPCFENEHAHYNSDGLIYQYKSIN